MHSASADERQNSHERINLFVSFSEYMPEYNLNKNKTLIYKPEQNLKK
jgi:hypothetical protein